MWMVRAGEKGYLIEEFKKKKIIAVGWNKIKDISLIKDKEQIKELIKEKYPEHKISQLGMATSQFSKFVLTFSVGDYAVSYDPVNRNYLLGEITSKYEYNSDLCEFHHIHKVNWLGEVPRDKISVSSKNSLGAISTIFEINEEVKTELINLLNNKRADKLEIEETHEAEESLKEDMISKAHEFIKDKVLVLD